MAATKLVPDNTVLIPPDVERAFAGETFDVYQWQQRLYDGSSARFEMFRRPDSVGLIGMVEDGILG